MLEMDSQNNPKNQSSNSQNSGEVSNDKESPDEEQKRFLNLVNQNPAPQKDLNKNKLNMNSSLNAKADTNTSNEQKKKEQSDSLDDDEDILYNDEEENEILAEYDLLDDNKLRTMDDLKNISKKEKKN